MQCWSCLFQEATSDVKHSMCLVVASDSPLMFDVTVLTRCYAEEWEREGSQYIPKDVEATMHKISKIDITIIHTLLDDFDRRGDNQVAKPLALTWSSASTYDSRPATSTSSKAQKQPKKLVRNNG